MKFLKVATSKFEGTHLDWQRFWSQIQCGIDCAEFIQVIKYHFLEEILKPKVRVLVNGLRFTAEGYERASKDSEVANTHIKSLISLATTATSNSYKINEF